MEHKELPKFSDLMIPIIEILKKKEGESSNEALISELKAQGFPDGGPQKGSKNLTQLEYRAAWARTYLKNVGALENPKRGHWSLTERGSSLTSQDVPNIVETVVKTSRKEKTKKPKKALRTKFSLQKSQTKSIEPVDQARIILDLLEKGILTQAAANQALSKVIGL